MPAVLLSAAACTGLPSPRHLVKVNLKNLKLLLVSNSGFSNFIVTHLKPAEMLTD